MTASLTVQTILVMFLWAMCFPLIYWGLPYAPHLTFAALRAFLAGVVLLVPALMMNCSFPTGLRTWMMLGAIGLGATTLGFLGMFHAAEFVSPGIATVIANTQPLMAAGLAAIVLKERLNRRGKAGLFLGFLGVLFIALPTLFSETGTDDRYVRGVVYIILAALGITVSNVLIRYQAGRMDALHAMGWQLVLGGVFLAIPALATEDVGTVMWERPFVLSLLGLAVPGTALAYWLWCRILEQAELNHANAFSFLVPVFGLSLGQVFFQEKIGAMVAAGIVMTVLGIVLVNGNDKNRQNITG
ncbi:DMT family transporter [Luteithermobacter gelatinilyticus]|uniref:DMT family transporter n=1 Tax=Luteithermobacter gelatinilyticus TaxID=2582913 RepID=UPI00110619F5|nr:DMT family transporter [Luteithermobacter gelatinilyticus]